MSLNQFILYMFIFILLLNKTLSNNTINYEKYVKNYYDIPYYYDSCKEYFEKFENEIFKLNENNVIYKNKQDKLIEYIF